jgi:hypothetical protein
MGSSPVKPRSYLVIRPQQPPVESNQWLSNHRTAQTGGRSLTANADSRQPTRIHSAAWPCIVDHPGYHMLSNDSYLFWLSFLHRTSSSSMQSVYSWYDKVRRSSHPDIPMICWNVNVIVGPGRMIVMIVIIRGSSHPIWEDQEYTVTITSTFSFVQPANQS